MDSSPFGGCFFLTAVEKTRVYAYIDGFNLYHAIDALNRPHLKWVDLWALVASFLREDQQLIEVNYYSAYATWLPEEFARQRQFTAALRASGVRVHMSDFTTRTRVCFTCGASWRSHEEKQTDVRMAVDMVADALEGKLDVAAVVTADSDLRPAVEKVRSTNGKRILVIAPPGRFSRARDLRHNVAITPGRIHRHLLPQGITVEGRVVATRPSQYDPPPQL